MKGSKGMEILALLSPLLFPVVHPIIWFKHRFWQTILVRTPNVFIAGLYNNTSPLGAALTKVPGGGVFTKSDAPL
jgi:hypothetical protein